MNPFTELVWDVLQDSPELLAQLAAIMRREYPPFLTGEQAFQANANLLESHIRKALDDWYEWLPDTPVNRIGGGLAVGMLDSVDWDQVARRVRENGLRVRVSALPNPGSMA